MKKIRFAVIGSGWRSLFYLRIARALPEMFSIAAVKVRNEEKKRAIEAEFNVKVVLSDDEIYALKPDFVVVAVNKTSLFSVSRLYLEHGIPVLCETCGAYGEEEIRTALSYKTDIQYGIAEQYFLYPEYSSIIKLLESGIIGRPVGLYLSVCHDYHAISLMRKLLLKDSHPRLLYTEEFEEALPGGFSRYSVRPDGILQKAFRKVSLYSFGSGEKVLYDFSSAEYHSPLRQTSYRIEGEKGEIKDGVVRYYDEKLEIHEAELIRSTDRITFQDKVLFENAFPGTVLSSDEYAITLLLVNFSKALLGEEKLLYPAREALLDALSALGAELGEEA